MVGLFDKILHEGYIWTGHRAVLTFILHKSISLHFLHHGTRFYEKYITLDDKKNYMNDYGSDVFPKQFFRKIYNPKYQSLIQIDIIS